MKLNLHIKRCAIAVLLVGFMGTAIAADRYNTIAGIVTIWGTNLGAGEVWKTEFTEALNSASDTQLADIQNTSNYDAIRAILQGRAVPVELDGVTGTEALGSLTSDLVFTPVVPCRFFDTRNDSDTGSIGHTSGGIATIRSYQVYGDAALMQNQGGTVACDAPQGEPVAISANFTAAPLASTSSGKGNIRAYPSGGTLPGVSLVNYEAGTNIANAAIVQTCYLCGSDLDVATQFHSSASIGDVMGYFYPAIGPTYVIGDTGPAGGIVFYVTADGLHGFEAAPTDQTKAPWGCNGTVLGGALGMALGRGTRNTGDILAHCAQSGKAADQAVTYSLNGYFDWFLPSLDELNLLYLQRNDVGGFSNILYWSSTEHGAAGAFARNFGNGLIAGPNKTAVIGVRPIRDF